MTAFDGNTFAYDARGRRTAKNGITFIYDSNGNLIKQSNGLEFLYDHTGVFALKYSGSTYFYRKNAQNDVIALLDTNGAAVVKYRYDAWGNCKVLNANGVEITDNTHIGILNPFRYRSYYYDHGIGLYFLKTRYYDPQIGRFMTIDDISYLDPENINGLNLYAYCENNPVNLVDYTGHAPEWLKWLGIGLAIVGTILVVAAVTVLTCGVGTLAGTMAGAVIYGAAQGVVIGAAVGVVAGGVIGGALSGWSAEGILIGMGIGLGGGAIIGGVIGGFARASSFTANSAYISQYGGTPKDVLSTFKGNPKLKILNNNTTVYRTWGGGSGKYGHWISPKNYGSAAKSMLSLPPVNTATNTSSFLISKGSTVLTGKAAALFGQTGGGIQWWIGLL